MTSQLQFIRKQYNKQISAILSCLKQHPSQPHHYMRDTAKRLEKPIRHESRLRQTAFILSNLTFIDLNVLKFTTVVVFAAGKTNFLRVLILLHQTRLGHEFMISRKHSKRFVLL